MSYDTNRRDFMLASSSTVLAAGLLSGNSIATNNTDSAPNGKKLAASEVSTSDGYIIETEDGELMQIRPDNDGPSHQSSKTASSTSGEEIRVALSIVSAGPSFASNSTADIFIGAIDSSNGISNPVENKTLSITVERPDGETETFEKTTGEFGNAHVEYDLSETNREDGQYTVSVADEENGVETDQSFRVGTAIDITTRSWSAIAGEESSVAILTRNGETPESDVELDVTVDDPEGEVIIEESLISDEDGFATVTLTPEKVGGYSINVEESNGSATTSSVVETNAVIATSVLQLRHSLSGEKSVYGGYLKDMDGFLPNTDFEIKFVERSSDDNVIIEKNVTTDEVGFFLVEIEVPSDVDRDLTIQGETTDQTEIRMSVSRLRVNELDDEPDDDPLSFDASFSESRVVPGDDAEVTVEAEYNDEPITDAEVDIFLQYGFDGVPMFSTTVTTDDTGTASTTVPVPSDAPDGSSLEGEAVLSYDDELYRSSLRVNIEQYSINFDAPAASGESTEFSLSVTNNQTGSSAEGIPLSYDAQYSRSRSGSFDQGSLISGDDGEDTSTVDFPDNVEFFEYSNYRTRYFENIYRWLEPEYPGELSVQSDTVAAGEAVVFEFTIPDDQTAYGIVFTRIWSPDVTIGTQISSNESETVVIPEYAAGESTMFRLWAAGEDGTLYSDDVWIDIEGEPETRAVIDVSAETVEANETVVFDATNSTAGEGSLSYTWDFDDGTTDDQDVVEHSYEESGTYDVSLTVVDEDENTDTSSETIEVEDPDDDEDKPTVDDYRDENGDVDRQGVFDVISDWQEEKEGVDRTLVFNVISAWRSE